MATYTYIRANVTASRHRSISPFGSGRPLVTAGAVDDNYVNVGLLSKAGGPVYLLVTENNVSIVTESGSGIAIQNSQYDTITEYYYNGTSATDPYIFSVSDEASGVWLVKPDETIYINNINSLTPVP